MRDRAARSQSRLFAKAMSAAGNRCEVAEFDGAHTTFGPRPGNPVFPQSLARVDAFLVSLGYLSDAPDVEARIGAIELPSPRRKRSARDQTG